MAQLERIKRTVKMVSYNPSACQFINKLNEKMGWNLQHAENGGEIIISGYSLDGYDKEKNIVFEYDERHHRYDKFIKKDKKRQSNIILEINPKLFIRYREWNDKLLDILTNKKLDFIKM